MSDSALTLTGATLERALPFRVTWDATGRLQSVSPALARYWALPDRAPDRPADGLQVQLRRPFRAPLHPRWFPDLTGMSLEVCAGMHERVLHAELFPLEGGAWLLVGLPRVERTAELERAGVALGELPAHLGLGYVLLTLEATRIAHAASAESARQREAAEAAARAKSQFLANMSHELRTPLTAVMGFLHLCLRSELNPRQTQYLTNAQAAAKTLLDLISDVLDFSKLEADAVRLEQVQFELAAILAQAESLLAQSARDKGLEFVVDLNGWPPPLLGDPHRIGQIVTNLLSNAVKFTERGRVSLSAQASPAADDRVTVEFRVSDTGIGIEHAQLGEIMKAFHQADASTTRRFGGTGLGLAISDHLVALMGGKLRVDSEPGRGSTFHFALTLPVARRMHAVTAPGAAATVDLTDLRVLVVDDTPMNRQVVADVLRQAGAVVSEAVDGHDALAALRAVRVDLVLMDLQMPALDGFAATRAIRADVRFAGLPVIALTANALIEDRRRAIECGMNDVVVQPVTPPELLATIARWRRRDP